jgi:NTP pyrophosphatase (non-canonical NTP hydrolase)
LNQAIEKMREAAILSKRAGQPHLVEVDELLAMLDSFTEPSLYDFAGATELIHALAREKGWWDCPTCNGVGALDGHPDYKIDCPTCRREGIHRNFGESIALCVSELAEALEAARSPGTDPICDKCDERGEVPVTIGVRACQKCGGTRQALGGSRIAEELADCVIRILDLCGHMGIDLGAVIAAKHAYNTTRPRKHGKRF